MVQVWYSYFNGKKQRVDKPSVFLFVLTRIRFLKSTGRSRRMDFKCNTQHLDSFGWSALPLHFPLLLQSPSMLRDTFPRYISIPPLVASVGTVHFIEPGSAKINILRPAAFAQRTRKARLLLTCGAIHLVPPPASCGEERHIPGLAGYLAVSVQVVRLPGAQFWSDGLILRRFTLRQT